MDKEDLIIIIVLVSILILLFLVILILSIRFRCWFNKFYKDKSLTVVDQYQRKIKHEEGYRIIYYLELAWRDYKHDIKVDFKSYMNVNMGDLVNVKLGYNSTDIKVLRENNNFLYGTVVKKEVDDENVLHVKVHDIHYKYKVTETFFRNTKIGEKIKLLNTPKGLRIGGN